MLPLAKTERVLLIKTTSCTNREGERSVGTLQMMIATGSSVVPRQCKCLQDQQEGAVKLVLQQAKVLGEAWMTL